jgi:hypothetical protein
MIHVYFAHINTLHYSDDIHGLVSKDIKDVHSGCNYINPVNGGRCSCHGLRPDKI